MALHINSISPGFLAASSITLIHTSRPISGSVTSSYVNLTASSSNGTSYVLFNNSSLKVSGSIIANTIDAGTEGNIYAKYFTAGAAFIGYLNGNADSATTATSATSATTAQTASYVSSNTLQNTITSGSLFLINNNTLVSGTFQVQVNTATNQVQPSLEVNSSGVLVIGKFNTPPTAVSGGIYFDGTDFYFGI